MQNVGEIKVVLKGKKESAFTLVGAANQQLAILENSMKLGGLVTASRQLNYSNGAKIVASITQGFKTVEIFFPDFEEVKKEEELEIEIPPAGFFCHVMTDDFPKGMKLDKSAVATGPYTYPLVDGDHGTFYLKPVGERANPKWNVLRPTQNNEDYGNLDFGNSKRVFSLRGPSGRQLALNPLTHFDGFTFLDEVITSIEGDVSYYTPFSKYLYYKGKSVFTLPVLGVTDVKLLGVALVTGIPVVVLGTNYRGIENPDETTGGFYIEIWKKLTTWERAGFQSSSRHLQPWFFAKSGLETVSLDSKLTLNAELTEVVFSTLTSGSGLQTNHYANFGAKEWGTSQTGSWLMFADYSENELKQVQLNLLSEESSAAVGATDTVMADLVLKWSGIPDVLSISGPEDYTTPGDYGVSGGIGPYIWTYPAGGSCGTQSVGVTDFCGQTASKTVRMATGVWLLISDTHPNAGSEYCQTTCISGDSKTVENFPLSNLTLWTNVPCVPPPPGNCCGPVLPPGDLTCKSNSTCGAQSDNCQDRNGNHIIYDIDYILCTRRRIYNWVCA